MIQINLLPHREEKRKAKRQQFYALVGLVAIVASVLIGVAFMTINGYISAQEERNDFLKREVAALGKQIEQIKGLQAQTESLKSRQNIIESLQRDRSMAVHLLAELVKRLPEGMYIRSLKQNDLKVTINGYAQSSARVSALMRAIEDSPWLERPQLVEVKAVLVNKRRMNEFHMEFYLRSEGAAVQPQKGRRK